MFPLYCDLSEKLISFKLLVIILPCSYCINRPRRTLAETVCTVMQIVSGFLRCISLEKFDCDKT